MRITYRVIDKRTNKDITDDYYWVMRPDGSILYYDYDLIGFDYAKAVVTVTETEIPSVTCIPYNILTSNKGELNI